MLVENRTAAPEVESECDVDAVPCDMPNAVLSSWLCQIFTLDPEVTFMFASA